MIASSSMIQPWLVEYQPLENLRFAAVYATITVALGSQEVPNHFMQLYIHCFSSNQLYKITVIAISLLSEQSD
jgi:hypothetical protein